MNRSLIVSARVGSPSHSYVPLTDDGLVLAEDGLVAAVEWSRHRSSKVERAVKRAIVDMHPSSLLI
ncbi:MAG: hypothetical protein KTR25_07175 [Myxococcales bacterium]|nr:hypothetical protein [Myxococcales bacterium]